MATVVLHLDEALKAQATFQSYLIECGARSIPAEDLGPALRLWARPKALSALQHRINRRMEGLGPCLTFMGSGDFHHVSALLIQRAVNLDETRPLTVVHFDNHPDWVRFYPGLHCGSWASSVARMTGVRKIISIGMCSSDLDAANWKGADLEVVHDGRLIPFPLKACGNEDRVIAGRMVPSIQTLGHALFLESLDSLIGTDDIYITIDKDVLSSLDVLTNWDQGDLRLSTLLPWIETISTDRRVRGADVVGDVSRPVYGPRPLDRVSKWVEARLDQPRWHPPSDLTLRMNAQSNRALLDALSNAIDRPMS